jgi:polyisoprenyl-teichoic acid--peptidoglycan teichoic acid transferase
MNQPDPNGPTQPSYIVNQEPTRPIHFKPKPGKRKPFWSTSTRLLGCLSILILLFSCLVVVGSLYFLSPIRSQFFLLGIDYAEAGSFTGRSDTIILTTIEPFRPYVGILSIPRDLWVTIPGIGENRINTAHFFAEANQAGSGPEAVSNTLLENFGVDINYYLRVRFDDFRKIVDAMGGLDIFLDKPTAGYPAGSHHLTGNKALAFARNRIGSDDFFRMERGQILIKAAIKQMTLPTNWVRIPSVIEAISQSIDSNIPLWMGPRIAFAILRTGVDRIDNQTITREMVTPFTTSQGANVLLPRWELIRPLVNKMFQP